jgi:DnaJ-class molecular chaperone
MTIKQQKNRNYDLVEDDRWKRKGVVHTGKENDPEICPECGGLGRISEDEECLICFGEGIVYE